MSTWWLRYLTWTARVAKIVIHYTIARQQSDAITLAFIRKILREMRFIARLAVSHGPYTMGNLAKSIKERGPFLESGSFVRGEVGSELPYARSVEEGAVPHMIFPIPPKTYLRFYWRKRGRIVTPPSVNHPGQQGKGYLAEAARTIGRRYNLRVIIY